MNAALKKSLITVGIISSIGAVAYGIYLFYKRQVALALQFCYKIADFNLYKVSKELINFELFVKIQNNSNLSLTINSYDLDVILAGRKIANLKSSKSIQIFSTNVSTIPLMINFNPSEVFDKDYLVSLLAYMVTDQTKVTIQVVGTMDITMDFVHLKKFKFNYETTMSKIINSKADENMQCAIV